MSAFPALRSLTVTSFGRASLDPLLAALAAAPPSLTRFATSSSMPPTVLEALPATITELAVTPVSISELQGVLDRWFADRDRAEVGRLRRLVVRVLSEREAGWHGVFGPELFERVRGEGCQAEYT